MLGWRGEGGAQPKGKALSLLVHFSNHHVWWWALASDGKNKITREKTAEMTSDKLNNVEGVHSWTVDPLCLKECGHTLACLHCELDQNKQNGMKWIWMGRTVSQKTHFICVITFSDNKWKNPWMQHCVHQAPCCFNHGCIFTTNNKSNHISNNIYCLSINVGCQCILWKVFGSLIREAETIRLWERSKRRSKHEVSISSQGHLLLGLLFHTAHGHNLTHTHTQLVLLWTANEGLTRLVHIRIHTGAFHTS